MFDVSVIDLYSNKQLFILHHSNGSLNEPINFIYFYKTIQRKERTIDRGSKILILFD